MIEIQDRTGSLLGVVEVLTGPPGQAAADAWGPPATGLTVAGFDAGEPVLFTRDSFKPLIDDIDFTESDGGSFWFSAPFAPNGRQFAWVQPATGGFGAILVSWNLEEGVILSHGQNNINVGSSTGVTASTPSSASNNSQVATTEWVRILGAGYVVTGDPRLTDARTPLAHTHVTADVTGLDAALAAEADDRNPPVAVVSSPATSLDLAAVNDAGGRAVTTLSTDCTLSFTGIQPGLAVTIKVIADAIARTLTVAGAFRGYSDGVKSPVVIPANKSVILAIECDGTAIEAVSVAHTVER